MASRMSLPSVVVPENQSSASEGARLYSDCIHMTGRAGDRPLYDMKFPRDRFLRGCCDDGTAYLRAVRIFSVSFREAEYFRARPCPLSPNSSALITLSLVVEPDNLHGALAHCRAAPGAPVSEPSDIPILMLSKMDAAA